MTRSTLSAIGAAILIGLAIVFVAGRCSVQTSAPLPAPVQAAVDRHVVASAVDTATTNRLQVDTTRFVRQQRAAKDSQRILERAASIEKWRGDSLEAVARAATTARDSAIAYHAASDANRARGDTLQRALAQSGAQLQAAAARQAATDTIALTWQRHAERADSLIAQLLPLARENDRCRIAWVFHCPSRKAVAIGGAVLGAGVALVATGKVKIPRLPIALSLGRPGARSGRGR